MRVHAAVTQKAGPVALLFPTGDVDQVPQEFDPAGVRDVAGVSAAETLQGVRGRPGGAGAGSAGAADNI